MRGSAGSLHDAQRCHWEIMSSGGKGGLFFQLLFSENPPRVGEVSVSREMKDPAARRAVREIQRLVQTSLVRLMK